MTLAAVLAAVARRAARRRPCARAQDARRRSAPPSSTSSAPSSASPRRSPPPASSSPSPPRRWAIWALPVFAVPLLLTQFSFRRYATIEATYLQTIRSLSKVTEVGGYTETGHSRRVSRLAVTVGREMGLTERDLDDLEYAALMHDIGQLSLTDPIPGGATTMVAAGRPAPDRRARRRGHPPGRACSTTRPTSSSARPTPTARTAASSTTDAAPREPDHQGGQRLRRPRRRLARERPQAAGRSSGSSSASTASTTPPSSTPWRASSSARPSTPTDSPRPLASPARRPRRAARGVRRAVRSSFPLPSVSYELARRRAPRRRPAPSGSRRTHHELQRAVRARHRAWSTRRSADAAAMRRRGIERRDGSSRCLGRGSTAAKPTTCGRRGRRRRRARRATARPKNCAVLGVAEVEDRRATGIARSRASSRKTRRPIRGTCRTARRRPGSAGGRRRVGRVTTELERRDVPGWAVRVARAPGGSVAPRSAPRWSPTSSDRRGGRRRGRGRRHAAHARVDEDGDPRARRDRRHGGRDPGHARATSSRRATSSSSSA